jgi:hypothetical protein
MGIFGGKSGSVWFESKSDPRWKWSGRAESITFTSGPPREAQEALERLKAEYGEPPDDLEWGGMKD